MNDKKLDLSRVSREALEAFVQKRIEWYSGIGDQDLSPEMARIRAEAAPDAERDRNNLLSQAHDAVLALKNERAAHERTRAELEIALTARDLLLETKGNLQHDLATAQARVAQLTELYDNQVAAGEAWQELAETAESALSEKTQTLEKKLLELASARAELEAYQRLQDTQQIDPPGQRHIDRALDVLPPPPPPAPSEHVAVQSLSEADKTEE